MGQQLIKNTDIDKTSFGFGGYKKSWQLFKGVRQDTKKRVCVFLIDKQKIGAKELEFLKKEPLSLQKYKHPQILQIVDPLIEDKKGMGFVTEEFVCTLQQKFDNNQEVCGSMIELKMHLLHLFQILNFLHFTTKSGHFNLSPNNIYIMPDGSWKIGGFQFTSQILDNEVAINNISDTTLPDWNYTAPEIVSTKKGSFKSDIFSVGMLLLQILKHMNDQGKYSPLFTITSAETFKIQIQGMSPKLKNEMFYQSLEQSLKELIQKVLQYKPNGRPHVTELMHIEWFNDPFVKAIKHLETIIDIDKNQQPVFLKGLGQIMFKYPSNILKKRIFPQVLQLLQHNHLIQPVLQISLNAMEKLQKDEFQKIVWPHLKKLTTSKELPAQALYGLVENLEKFVDIVGKNEVNESVIPLLLKCFDCSVPKLQELALLKVEFLVKTYEYQQFTKPKIIPRLMNMLGNEKTALQIKQQNLCLIKNLLGRLDKHSISDLLIPALDKLRKTKIDIQIRMQMLQIYRIIAKDIEYQVIGKKLIPSLLPFLFDPNIKRNEYIEYSKTIQQLLKKVDEDRLKELPQEDTAFNFDQIANSTENKLKQKEQQKKDQQVQQQSQQGSNFDFLDFLNNPNGQGTDSTNTNTQNSNNNNNQQQQQSQPITNNNNNNNGDDDDFFSDFNNQQPVQLINSNSQPPAVSNQPPPQDDDFFSDFSNQNQQQQQVQPPKQNNNNTNKVPEQKKDPFFDQFNSQQKSNTLQNNFISKPPQQKSTTTNNLSVAPPGQQKKPQQQQQSQPQVVNPPPQMNNNFGIQPPPASSTDDDPFGGIPIKNTQPPAASTNNSNNQQKQDPFFAQFQQQSGNSFTNQQQQQKITSGGDDFFSNFSSQNNQNNNNNNNNNNFVGSMNNFNQPSSNYDDPFAEITQSQNNNNNNNNFGMQNNNNNFGMQNNINSNNNDQQQQQKGKLFSKLSIKKPPQQKKQWNFDNISTEQQNPPSQQQNQQQSNNDFDDLF